jgi:hypothetical protein
MSHLPLRRLLSKLAALALTTSQVGPAVAADETELYDTDTPIDREHVAAGDAALALGRGLALALTELRPLTATQLVATWALSPDPVRRLAVAHALEWTFPLVGDALAIDHLSRDRDAAVRAAAARAAWVRRATGGDAGVLDRLADDPEPAVRAIASAAR